MCVNGMVFFFWFFLLFFIDNIVYLFLLFYMVFRVFLELLFFERMHKLSKCVCDCLYCVFACLCVVKFHIFSFDNYNSIIPHATLRAHARALSSRCRGAHRAPLPLQHAFEVQRANAYARDLKFTFKKQRLNLHTQA